jgi:hypothetical protein
MNHEPYSRVTSGGRLCVCIRGTPWRADGLRQWKQTASGTDTYFLYDGAQPICEFIIQNGGVTLLALNTWGPTGLAARNSPTTGSNTFYAWDGRGDVAQTVNTSGVVTPFVKTIFCLA